MARFLVTSSSEVLGQLTANQRHRQVEQAQIVAWTRQIEILKDALAVVSRGHLFLEFEIPRVGRLADAVLLIDDLVIVLEFKVGATHFERAAIDQTEDYALDLKNFHRGSHNAVIIPVLVATEASATIRKRPLGHQLAVKPTICTGKVGLPLVLKELEAFRRGGNGSLDPLRWASSPYAPTPTIVEAACALYKGHQIANLSRSDAGATNLSRTCTRIFEIIDRAKRTMSKSICFVTGVPGSGKTLAGLNVATERMRSNEEEHAVFLSGNGPLVAVLQEALAQDELRRQGPTKMKRSEARRKSRAFIQNIHRFRDDSLKTAAAPVERVAVFDEAQRAWDRDQTSKFMRNKRDQPSFSMSEPEFLLSVMDRHPDWCVVICLVGTGQEINTGEAGIQEWFSALENLCPDWTVYLPSRLSENDSMDDLRRTRAKQSMVTDDDLHLSVSLRSFRSERLAEFVNAVLNNQSDVARELLALMPDYPICLTRNLGSAREWLKRLARGSERIGLVASSNGIRLRPHGIQVKVPIEPELWFLRGKDDIRSSFQLEDAATEFEVQGLELDWVGVCWDANLRRESTGWKEFRFKGTKWQKVNHPADQRFTRNAYRVLLTRARQGFIVFVPPGNDNDPTCASVLYDQVYSFLRDCGIPSIDGDSLT